MTRKHKKKVQRPAFSSDDFIRRISDCEYTLLCSDFFLRLIEQIQKCCTLIKIKEFSRVVCLGLGKFTECTTSKYQLAILMLIKRKYNVPVAVYDPVFSEHELDFLQRLEVECIKENEHGATFLQPNTFIFLPHCPNGLVNNLLWRNWNIVISTCVFYCNSFKLLAENLTTNRFMTDYHYIYSILPYTEEIDVDNCFKFTDIFNDLSLHIFLSNKLNKLPDTFWDRESDSLPNDLDDTELNSKTG